MTPPPDPTAVSGVVVSTTTGPDTDHLGATEAGRLLGISPRRVRAYVAAGRLTVVSDQPLKVSRASVQILADERLTAGLEKATNHVSIDPAQLQGITEALATIMVEVAGLRADLATTRIELAAAQQPRELEAPPRQRWWRKAPPH